MILTANLHLYFGILEINSDHQKEVWITSDDIIIYPVAHNKHIAILEKVMIDILIVIFNREELIHS